MPARKSLTNPTREKEKLPITMSYAVLYLTSQRSEGGIRLSIYPLQAAVTFGSLQKDLRVDLKMLHILLQIWKIQACSVQGASSRLVSKLDLGS